MINIPKISVITVTYNAENFIKRTLKSVSEQTYTNIEHLIIDGNSKDNTLNIVNENKNNYTFVISEPDNGLYDAMNKGINFAKGEYLIFMNAGDVFYSSNIIEYFFSNLDKDYDFIYGNATIVDENGNEFAYHKSAPLESEISKFSFLNGMTICHQSIFVKKNKCLRYNTDLYKICSDIDWSIRVVSACNSFKYKPLSVCKFLAGGISHSNKKRAWKERFLILKFHFGIMLTFWAHSKFICMYIKSKIL